MRLDAFVSHFSHEVALREVWSWRAREPIRTEIEFRVGECLGP